MAKLPVSKQKAGSKPAAKKVARTAAKPTRATKNIGVVKGKATTGGTSTRGKALPIAQKKGSATARTRRSAPNVPQILAVSNPPLGSIIAYVPEMPIVMQPQPDQGLDNDFPKLYATLWQSGYLPCFGDDEIAAGGVLANGSPYLRVNRDFKGILPDLTRRFLRGATIKRSNDSNEIESNREGGSVNHWHELRLRLNGEDTPYYIAGGNRRGNACIVKEFGGNDANYNEVSPYDHNHNMDLIDTHKSGEPFRWGRTFGIVGEEQSRDIPYEPLHYTVIYIIRVNRV